MARKVRKVQRTGKGAADGGSRWTVRGVPPGIQRAAGDAARARGITLGQFVTEALEFAVGQAALPAADAAPGWTEAIERRLERLEQAVLPSATPSTAAEPATAA